MRSVEVPNVVSENLSEGEAEQLIIDIVRQTRVHPLVRVGAGVKGTVALKVIVKGYSEIRGGALNGEIIEKSALITLPHRILVKYGTEKTPEDIVKEITRKVLARARMSKIPKEALKEALRALLDDMMNKEDSNFGLDPNPKEFPSSMDQEGTYEENLEDYKNLLSELEEEGLLEMTDENRFGLTEEAIDMLSKDLETRYKREEMSEEEYLKAKDRLEKMLQEGQQHTYAPDDETLSNVIAEVMDLQDKFGSSTKFDEIYAHYLVKSNQGEEINSDLTDYKKLQVIVHGLDKKGLIKGTKTDRRISLTDDAFIMSLNDFISRTHIELQVERNYAKLRSDSEKIDVRKYKPGDMFRDVSVPQTVREVVKQRKINGSMDVRKKDIRVFVRKPTSLNTVLAIDVSHSMGFKSKLRFARIAASSLAKAAIQENDKIAIVTFSNFAETVTPLVNRINPIMNSIVPLKAKQYTNIGDGIKCSRELLLKDRSSNPGHIILLTDGEPTAASSGPARGLSMEERKIIGEQYAVEEARKTVAERIKISIILITSPDEPANTKFAEKISRIGRGYFIKAAAEDLPSKVVEAWEKVKSQI
jgi:Mg-chelatase subunit ChlD/predicted transcriptional regulator